MYTPDVRKVDELHVFVVDTMPLFIVSSPTYPVAFDQKPKRLPLPVFLPQPNNSPEFVPPLVTTNHDHALDPVGSVVAERVRYVFVAGVNRTAGKPLITLLTYAGRCDAVDWVTVCPATLLSLHCETTPETVVMVVASAASSHSPVVAVPRIAVGLGITVTAALAAPLPVVAVATTVML